MAKKKGSEGILITSRTVAWLGLLIALIGGLVVALILYSIPPQPTSLFLLFLFLFITVSALVTGVHAFLLHSRGKAFPEGSFFHGLWIGSVVLLLLLAQYIRILDWITLGVILVLALMGEGVYAYMHRARRAQASPTSGKKTTVQASTRARVKGVRKGKGPSR